VKFRKEALRNVQLPDDATAPVELVSTRSWIGLIVLSAVVAGGIVWSVVARIPVTAEAPGILSFPEGSFRVQAAVAGQVTAMAVSPGKVLAAGDAVAQLVEAGGHRVTVHTAIPGRVAEVVAGVGSVVAPGSAVVIVERILPGEQMVAVVYLPSDTAAVVVPGTQADLSVDAAPSALFGSMRGRVTEVDTSSERRSQVTDFVGDPELAASLVGAGTVRRVVVDLTRDPGTASGYVWTRRGGPSFPIPSRSGVHAVFHQPGVRPIDWVLR
jgi:multidrug efflux pump subunit AcrA (membrane-fusion protein)